MNRNRWLAVAVILLLTATGIVFSAVIDTLLLSKFPWLLIISVFTGVILGAFHIGSKGTDSLENGELTRHSTGSFVQHWMTVLGIFLLIISAFIMGFLFFHHLADTPQSVLFPLNLHFIGLIITLLGGFYFITDHMLSKKIKLLTPGIKDIINGTLGKYILRKKWNREGKYLASQKSAFLAYAVLGGVQLITGSIKVLGHFVNIPSATLAITTSIHDIFSLLFIIMLVIHILFVILSAEHRILLKSWFTGKVNQEYAKEKHDAWYYEIKSICSHDEKQNSGDFNEN
jgi:cytochrome b subunit of formate dehydrogenase